jgi:hypothetical protein
MKATTTPARLIAGITLGVTVLIAWTLYATATIYPITASTAAVLILIDWTIALAAVVYLITLPALTTRQKGQYQSMLNSFERDQIAETARRQAIDDRIVAALYAPRVVRQIDQVQAATADAEAATYIQLHRQRHTGSADPLTDTGWTALYHAQQHLEDRIKQAIGNPANAGTQTTTNPNATTKEQ